ncbi:hypothetical protein BJY04DRAFT_203898 [Aspergillus karnatakaensis]|uniref:uncharacterized protein n=1 Tax=Aspergillus karnatakaensis TaxID=1810916 RepID=UPI003CCE2164
MADNAPDTSSMTKQELLDLANKIPVTKSTRPTLMGWPAAGGVWVLKPTEAQLEEYNRLPVTTDTEEHCRNLESLGATYYSSPGENEEVKAVLESVGLGAGQEQAERQKQ